MATALTIENSRLRVEFNEPGVHPFLSLLLPAAGGEWEPAVFLGARQVKYAHKGSSFPRLFADGDEQESSAELEVAESRGSDATASLTDIRGGFEIASEVELLDRGPVLRVTHTLTSLVDVTLNRAFDRFDLIFSRGTLDYWFVPHLRPEEDMVIGDQVFRSPVIMMRKGEVFFALMPDLDLLAGEYAGGKARYYLDMLVSGGENQSPAVSFGLGRSRPSGHVYFREDFKRGIAVKAGDRLSLGYHLFVGREDLRGEVLSFLWDTYGSRHLHSGRPHQAVSLDRYASAGLSRIFKRPDLFKEFELDGQPCGGSIGLHLVSRRGVRLMNRGELDTYLEKQDATIQSLRRLNSITSRPAMAWLRREATYLLGPKVPPQILFQSWFNNLRSAYGAYWFARKWNDHELRDAALAVKNLAVLAPREEGAFPAVCYVTEEGVDWCRGTQAFKHVDRYHTADCATTAYYMALWHRDHEDDPRLLGRCRGFAEFLLRVQLPSGAFPAWVEPAHPSPIASEELKESATSACPAMFLALLFTIDPDDRYLEAAKRAAGFIASEVIPRQKWFDYETFYSCAHKSLDMFDHYTDTFPQNTMSMYWAAEMYRLLHLATGDAGYLELGVQVLNHLCLYQQVWDPPFLSIDGFGGFGVMNADAEWNDARQGIIAPVLMEYYRATGDPRHMERGIAALRASFTTMYIEENRLVAPGNMKSVHREEMGSVAENYGHFGYDYRTTGYLEADWGAGSASYAAAYAEKHFGDVFVDVERVRGFGVNGCRVDGVRRSDGKLAVEVTKQVDSGLEILVKLSDPALPEVEVEVNGVAAGRTAAGYFRAVL